MPKLKNLELAHCPPLPTEDVNLPQLESVKLVGDLAPCSVILAYLKVPSDCNIDISCLDITVYDHFRLLTPTLARMLRSLGAMSKEESISLSIYFTALLLHNPYHHRSGKGRFFVRWSTQNFTNTLLPLLSLLQIVGSDTNDLTLTNLEPPVVTGRLVVDILLSFPKVETLRMSKIYTFHYLLPLLSARINNSEIGDQLVLLPRLTNISLFGTPFGDDLSSDQLSTEDLLNLLRQRAEMGVPISTVKFENCDGSGFEEGIGKIEQLGVLVDLEEPHRSLEDH
ncbi:hypothetical protein BDZ97DRAFT_1846134 [Flammula alnicola]|nr:hypothetical protein BDZ97DRAFT_1846134 [Flammula alnicola]